MREVAACVDRYQTYLHQLDEETRARLLYFSREVIIALQLTAERG
jgi:hypothetical protein